MHLFIYLFVTAKNGTEMKWVERQIESRRERDRQTDRWQERDSKWERKTDSKRYQRKRESDSRKEKG